LTDSRFEVRPSDDAPSPRLRYSVTPDTILRLSLRRTRGGSIRSADTVLVCSRNEGFGRVTVEAMLAARPLVGARSGGTAELVRDGENGLLYEPGDVEELTGIVRRMVEFPDESRRMGENARRWATKRFTEERFADEILACLGTVARA
jgi:glycosyltransferase involved in cell wall biosynthesis